MYTGIINMYKPRGMTSHDVVYRMRKITGQKKIGHTGTLDPEAEGVLPVCLGSATRLCELLGEGTKQYRAVMLLGLTTDTQDVYGTVLSQREVCCSEEQIPEVLSHFLGNIIQIPPMYSAVKYQGKKLYQLARKGIEVERSGREVTIEQLRLDKLELPELTMTVTCSRGTYIRTLCNDIGEELGCGGCMKQLIRTRVKEFTLEDALTLEEAAVLHEQGKLEEHIIPPDAFYPDAPKAGVHREDQIRLTNGNPFRKRQIILQEKGKGWPEYLRFYDENGGFVGLYKWDKRGLYRPEKMFI